MVSQKTRESLPSKGYKGIVILFFEPPKKRDMLPYKGYKGIIIVFGGVLEQIVGPVLGGLRAFRACRVFGAVKLLKGHSGLFSCFKGILGLFSKKWDLGVFRVFKPFKFFKGYLGFVC